MRIISLEAENFKRLKAISITPTGSIVEVTGDNGHGKSSTLDAIWAALGGKGACPAKPIHTGEKDAEIRLVLGDDGEPKLKVTRRFRLKEGVPYTTDLVVEGAEGGKYDEAQGVLNALVGEFCFEPMAFLDMKDEAQITTLRKFVPAVDFDAMARLNKKDYDDRTEVGRTVRDLKGQLAALPVPEGDVPEAVDTAALEAKLADASTHNTDIATRKGQRDQAQARVKEIDAQIIQLTEQRTNLLERLAAAGPLPEPIDVEEVQAQLSLGRMANAARAQAAQHNALSARLKAAEDQAEAFTTAIDKRKADAAAAVLKAKMPVEGLGFGEDAKGDGFVTLNGEPLAQASMAQKIRAGVAIAAALNPKLRVARITDGSLLDKKSWAILTQYAEANDLQIWVETVDAKTKGAVLIQDGSVATGGDPGDVI